MTNETKLALKGNTIDDVMGKSHYELNISAL